MKVAVLLKQVPDVDKVQFDRETGRLLREKAGRMLNPYDLYALEYALQLKDEVGAKVVAITMGPPEAREVLEEAISRGVDDAVLITGKEFVGSDTLATARVLSRAIEKLRAKIVVAGKVSADGDTGHVGPQVAALLGWDQITYAVSIEKFRGTTLWIKRKINGHFEIVRDRLPLVITVEPESNRPRLPSIRGLLRLKQFSPKVWGVEDLSLDPGEIGLNGSPTVVSEVFEPEISSSSGKEVSLEEAVSIVEEEIRILGE